MSRIQRTLTIYTSLGQTFNYTLQVTVPPNTLSKCSASLPRPNWEPVLYYTIICVMGFIMFCILVASYFEADRIFVADILKRKVKLCNGGSALPQKEQLFDLKAIGLAANGTAHTTIPTPKMAPLPANLLNKFPRPLLEIPNGHVQHKTRESPWTWFTNTIKTLFIRKQTANKKKVENNNSINSSPIPKTQADSKPTLATVSSQSEKEKMVTTETIISSEKSNTSYTQPQQKVTLRKTKAAKRSHYDTTGSVDIHNTPVNTSFERKNSAKTSSSSQAEKRAVDTSNTVKDNTPTPLPNVTVQSSSGLDTFDDIKLYDSKC